MTGKLFMVGKILKGLVDGTEGLYKDRYIRPVLSNICTLIPLKPAQIVQQLKDIN